MKDHNYLSQKAIIERGWSKRLIDKYLTIPDKEKDNPYYHNGSKMKLYLISRIEEIENMEEFKQEYLTVQKRKVSGKKASETHKNKLETYLLEWLNNIENNIQIPIMSTKKLIIQTIEHYNMIHNQRIMLGQKNKISFDIDDILIDNFINVECNEEDVLFLRRICLNYLRHAFNDYDVLLEETNIKYWKEEAYLNMKNMILDRIFEAYPYLKNHQNSAS